MHTTIIYRSTVILFLNRVKEEACKLTCFCMASKIDWIPENEHYLHDFKFSRKLFPLLMLRPVRLRALGG